MMIPLTAEELIDVLKMIKDIISSDDTTEDQKKEIASLVKEIILPSLSPTAIEQGK